MADINSEQLDNVFHRATDLASMADEHGWTLEQLEHLLRIAWAENQKAVNPNG